MYDPDQGITSLIPPSMREQVKAGRPPLYNINRPDYDRLPLNTFLIDTEMGTEGRVLEYLGRLVMPRRPENYPVDKRSAQGRLVYVCWVNRALNAYRSSLAVKKLAEVKQKAYRHIILPSDPRHEKIAAFKILCDTKRAWGGGATPVKPDLLYDALGLPLPELT